MSLRRLGIRGVSFLLHLFCRLKVLVAYLFYPLVRYFVEQEFARYGIKLVKGKRKREDEIGILKDEKKFILRLVDNPLAGLNDSWIDELIDMDPFHIPYTIFRSGKSRWLKDEVTVLGKLFNLQVGDLAWDVASHYNTGNDLFEKMLDPYMQYSCAYWKDAKDLNSAQLSKLRLIGQKLKLKPGMTVLDIGCGFGGLAKYLAENYGVSVVGCTVSKEQMKLGQQLCKGLPVEFYLCDYQKMKLKKRFDRVVSIAFMEAVGLFNYRTLYKIAEKALKDDGIFLLHTLGINSSSSLETLRWSHEHIFPNGWLPKLKYLVDKAEDLFVVEDIHNIGADYYNTLKAWQNNFVRAWPQLQLKYGDRFFKVWMMYLYGAQAMLQSRFIHVYQVVYSKKGILGGYRAPR